MSTTLYALFREAVAAIDSGDVPHLVFAFLAMTGCQGATLNSCGPYWPDIPYYAVDIPDDPPLLQLEELWRAGRSADGEEIVQPASLSGSAQGAVAVVDFGLAQVSVISPEGKWLGSWGRRGRGPGELTMPVTANWSGDTMLVFDIDQAKVVRYVASLSVGETRVPAEFITPVAMTGSIDFVAIASDGTVLLQQPLSTTVASDSSVLSILMHRPGATGAETLLRATVSHVEWDGSRMVQPGTAAPVVAVGADGWLAHSASDGTYRITWGDDDVRTQLCVEISPLPVMAEERGAGDASPGFEDVVEAMDRTQAPARLSAVGRMVVSSAGDLWVRRRRPRPLSRERLFGAPGGTMDIFASTGDYVGRAVIPDGVSIQSVSDSMAIGIEFSELDETTVVAYRVVR